MTSFQNALKIKLLIKSVAPPLEMVLSSTQDEEKNCIEFNDYPQTIRQLYSVCLIFRKESYWRMKGFLTILAGISFSSNT